MVACIRNVLSKKVNINGNIWELAILFVDSHSEVGDSVRGGFNPSRAWLELKRIELPRVRI